MRIHSISVALFLALGLVTAACGGSDDEEKYATQGEAVDAVAEAGCEYFITKCDAFEISYDDCVARARDEVCGGDGVDCAGPLPAGVTEAEVDACIDAVEALECGALGLPPACDEVESGSFAPNVSR